MLELYRPAIGELGFREKLLADEETMSYNRAWGGTIPFPQTKWKKWYQSWLEGSEFERYYRYLYDTGSKEFVGEAAWHYDGTRKIHLCDVIVLAKYRNRGFGSAGIRLLCDAAKENGIPALYDNIAAENPSYRLFLKNGFEIDGQDGDVIMVKKTFSYQDINAKTIDRWVKEDWEWGRPIDHAAYEAARNGVWDVKLTPAKYVPHEWFGELKGKKILGLASGGGQQMPVFSALGAICTVLDYSEEQIKSERLVAEREQYRIEMIRGDMTKKLPFADESFDLIFHPVSNCYVEQVKPIWRECYRILKPSGVLLAGLDNGINFLFAGDDETKVVNALPFDPIKNPEQMRQLQEDDCGVQFSHTLEEQLGGQLEAGFRLTALYEDTNGAGRLHEMNIPCFLATRAVK